MNELVFVIYGQNLLKYEDLPSGCHFYTFLDEWLFTYKGPGQMEIPYYHLKKWKIYNTGLLVFTTESWKKALLVPRKEKNPLRGPSGKKGCIGWSEQFGSHYQKNVSKSSLKGDCYCGIVKNGNLTIDENIPSNCWKKTALGTWIDTMSIKWGRKPFIDKEELSRLHLQKILGPTWVKSQSGGFAPSQVKYIGEENKPYFIPKLENVEEIFELYRTLGLTEMFSFSRKDHFLFLSNYLKLYTDRYVL